MKSFSAAIVASMAGSAMAFTPSSSSSQSSTALKAEMPERLWDSMVEKSERSKALPYLPRAKALDGSYPGDVGFDPFYLSSIPKNWAGFIQPPQWEETDGIDSLYWMREAELKHGRVAMLAVTGWLAVDAGWRFPFAQYSTDVIPNSYQAHDILVEQGTMAVLLMTVAFVEFCSSAVLVAVSKGELPDRAAGDFAFGAEALNGKTDEEIFNMKTKEVLNGRLAMLAFGGIATQTALGYETFPYF